MLLLAICIIVILCIGSKLRRLYAVQVNTCVCNMINNCEDSTCRVAGENWLSGADDQHNDTFVQRSREDRHGSYALCSDSEISHIIRNVG